MKSSRQSHPGLVLTVCEARRLALARAGLLKPEWTGFPRSAAGRGRAALSAALSVARRFGYLQLDTVSVAGARSHTIVLLSRLEGLDSGLGEELLRPGIPLFEYWGHEASWIPMELYPAFEFRRKEFQHHPWWGDLIGGHPEIAENLRRRIRDEGPLRSMDMEGQGSSGWWNLKVTKRVAAALWSNGELAIRERRNFQRIYDLTERVIPETERRSPLPASEAFEALLLKAFDGHGWATTGTLSATWRFKNQQREVTSALERLAGKGRIQPCALENPGKRPTPGWVRSEDLDLVSRLRLIRPRRDRGVLLSPFDPLLWDRARVRRLFDFDMSLEIFKSAEKRVYGYYCLPVLAGERLVGRLDLKADRKRGKLELLSCHFENQGRSGRSADLEAVRTALVRFGESVQLKPVGLESSFS